MSRIKVDRITDKAGTGAPTLVNGMNVTGKSTMGDIVGAAVTFNSITGGSANFSSDVSIGGTLTYEDVKNVDSVGLITARSGIDITGASAGVNGSSNLILKTGGTEQVRIDQFGRLALKTTNASLYNGSADDLIISNGTSDVGMTLHSTTQNSIVFTNGENTSWDGWLKYVHSDNHLQFGAGAGERLRIGAAGQIGVGGANYGTAGEVLTSGGPGAAVQWASPAGVFVKLASGSATDGDFIPVTTNLFTSTYFQYKIIFSCITTGGNPTRLGINFTKDNGNTWIAGNSQDYRYSSDGRDGSTNYSANASGQNGVFFLGSDAFEQWQGEIMIPDPSRTDTIKSANFVGSVQATKTTGYYSGTITSNVTYRPASNTVDAVTGIRFERNNSGGLTVLNWSLIGTAV